MLSLNGCVGGVKEGLKLNSSISIIRTGVATSIDINFTIQSAKNDLQPNERDY